MVQSLNEIAQRPKRFVHIFNNNVGDDYEEIIDINDHMEYCTMLYLKHFPPSSDNRIHILLGQEDVTTNNSTIDSLAMSGGEHVFTGIKLKNKIVARAGENNNGFAIMCWGY